MGIDAKTLMLMSLAIALIAGLALLAEGRATRDPAQRLWGFGFLAVAIGCAMTPLRDGISFRLGVWCADGLLIVAHVFFLLGSARYVSRRAPHRAWATCLLWLPLAAWPADANRTLAFAMLNAGLVGGLALGSSALLLRGRPPGDWAAIRLATIFGAHGLFYAMKAALAWMPGGFVDLVALKGVMIQASLVEGIPIETLLLLVMAASVRRRRERQLVLLAESDPLTGLSNRRGFDERARAMLGRGGPDRSSHVLLLCDLDHFKSVNDTYGHAAGDRLLMIFADLLRRSLPLDALVARYGGDEFVALVPGVDDQALASLEAGIHAGLHGLSHEAGAPTMGTTVTIGTARAAPGAELAMLMSRADEAAYEAKRRGRDRIAGHDIGRPAASTAASARSALRRAG